MPKKLHYDILDSYVLREPQMPISLFLDLISSKEVDDIRIKEILGRKAVRESIFITSPILWRQIEKWEKGNLDSAKKSEKTKLSILKYLARMSIRATPFGLFAGCGVKSFEIPFGISDEPQFGERKTYLNSVFINNIIQDISDSTDILPTIKFYTNNTLLNLNRRYRYIKRIEENGKNRYVIEEVPKTPELSKILKMARRGTYLSDIVESITGDDISFFEAKEYINELIEAKLLISELSLSKFDDDYLNQLVALLRKVGKNRKAEKIENALGSLKMIDLAKTNKVSKYRNIIKEVSEMGYKLEAQNLFHINSYQTNGFQLPESYKQHFLRALKILRILNDGYKNKRLAHFKEQFNKRYGSSKVRLLKVLDPDYGIDYLFVKDTIGASEVLEGINLKNHNRKSNVNIDRNDLILSKKIAMAIQNNEDEIILENSDFNIDEGKLENLPDTFSGIFEIIKTESIPLIRLKSLGGSSGVNLISRFAHANNAFKNQVHKISEIEKAAKPNHILAEIIHLPEGRLANILMRPNLRQYEIPILSPPDKENSILLEDLSIFLRDGDLILKSDKLDKEILPRLSNAHNYESSTLPIYRFLCDLQGQNTNNNLSLDLSFLGSIFPFIPRIVYEGVIISPARWQLEKDFCGNLFEEHSEPEKCIEETRKLRKRLDIPKLVLLIQGENEILVNLENTDCLKYFIQLTKNQSTIILHEFLFDTYHYQNGTSEYANEVVVTYFNKS